MNRKALMTFVMASTLVVGLGVRQVIAFGSSNVLLEQGRDKATIAIQQTTGKAGADQYIEYLESLIEQADCYLNGPLDTCDYEDSSVKELAAALDEGARAMVYLTSDYVAKKAAARPVVTTAQTAPDTQTTSTTAQLATAAVRATTENEPTASLMAASNTEKMQDNRADLAEDDTRLAEAGDTGETDTEAEDSDQASVEDASEDGAALRISLAVVAGAVIMAAGVMIIRKWSRENV